MANKNQKPTAKKQVKMKKVKKYNQKTDPVPPEGLPLHHGGIPYDVGYPGFTGH